MNVSRVTDPETSFSSADISQLTAAAADDYDYLSKIIIIGPLGVGKLCILHRFIKGDWNILASQTIGVEFSSKIVSVGFGQSFANLTNPSSYTNPNYFNNSASYNNSNNNHKGYGYGYGAFSGSLNGPPNTNSNNNSSSSRVKMKMQLWDTAGQERFRSLTRSYYRGSAGVVLVYDVTNRKSFATLHEFMADIKSLTNETVSIVVVGNKADLVNNANDPTNSSFHRPDKDNTNNRINSRESASAHSQSSSNNNPTSNNNNSINSMSSLTNPGKAPIDPTTIVSDEEALMFCAHYSQQFGYEIPFIKASALAGDNVGLIFDKVANMILAKLEIGMIDPEDALCGVQYGDLSRWDESLASLIYGGNFTGHGNGNGDGSRNNGGGLDFGNGQGGGAGFLRKKPTTISLLNRRATRFTNSGINGGSGGGNGGFGWSCC